jgi:hypothetical protein
VGVRCPPNRGKPRYTERYGDENEDGDEDEDEDEDGLLTSVLRRS